MLPDSLVVVVDVQWHGTTALELTYKGPDGRVANELLYRDDESRVEIAEAGRPWTFDSDGHLFRLVSEAKRIRLGYLFDPYLALTTALVDPLPHQITAVYEEMLPRQPLRFLLADDPGAGKTIMTGLYIRELMVRGDLRRCLVVAPGSLVEQWQAELDEKFKLPFDILTRDRINASRTGNPFNEGDLLIARLDKLARDEDLQQKLKAAQDWDLIVFDEAHKLSATMFGDELKETKRRKLGDLARDCTRHFLLLTATPHNGKDEDFTLFMSLLDPDRFERQHRAKKGDGTPDASDLMRRMVKESLVKFDGTPLFPARHAYVVGYELSDPEAALYEQVTAYVRDEMNRAERLVREGQGKRGTVVGFALTVLQRRLASSPEAIYQSLRRRRERLERKLKETEVLRQGAEARLEQPELDAVSSEDIEDLDDEAPGAEAEALEEQVLDLATAAGTIDELRAEIMSLRELERIADEVRRRETDTKWTHLSTLLQDRPEMFDEGGGRRKIVIFTEHRDTLTYLVARLRALIGRSEAVVSIHGGMARDARKDAEEAFKNDKAAIVLVATDAVGEGINLQRAHLMVNYDLPWNPNRIEQRFGRIHRIGQLEVCHLWNLVAHRTREGDVYARLLEKLAAESEALGGQVFDVLGRITFDERPLRDLLIEAIREGDRPEVRAQLVRVIEGAVDREHLEALLAERALGAEALDASRVQGVRDEMERANARRLQPHFVRTFFLEAFERLGGRAIQRERGRYEVTRVPALVRQRARDAGYRPTLRTSYERVAFDKELIAVAGHPLAEFVCPGHPLLDATIDVLMEQHRDLLKRGALLLDPRDRSDDLRVLVYLDHAIEDQRTTPSGARQLVSRRLAFVELGRDGLPTAAGPAPFQDYEPLGDPERRQLAVALDASWLSSADLEQRALSFAIEDLARGHLDEVRDRTEARVRKVMAAVKERLTLEINYWDHRAEELKAQELAGKTPRLNSGRARQRADELTERLQRRLHDLELERHLVSLPPVVAGGAIVVPAGLLARLQGRKPQELGAKETKRIELAAMDAVMVAERAMGYEPRDVSAENRGYDIESRDPTTGSLRFVEVKGRAEGATTVTVTRNEVLTCLNAANRYWLAVVEVDGEARQPAYLQAPFAVEPDFAATSINYSIAKLAGSKRQAAEATAG